MLKNIIKVLLSNATLAVVGLVNSLVFPLILSISDYAYYQKYLLYLNYVNICHLGIASGLFLNYAGHKYSSIDRKQYKSEIFLIYLVLAVFTAIGFVITGATRNQIILYVTISIFPECIIGSFRALYQSWERFTGYSIINALPKVVFTIIMIAIYTTIGTLSGNLAVVIYITIIWGLCLYFVLEFLVFTKGVKSNKIFSTANRATTISGFLITLGNYINLLFHSIDKQFVSILYSTESFAYYSFAMTMQNVMVIFITALSNPFYPRLARNDLSKKSFEDIKELLFIFGAYSGCAYFAVSFIVKHWITKYVPSLNVVSMFFGVFPAMAVINVLYINLYKIQRKLWKYVFTLIGMLFISFIANVIATILHGDYIGISLATMICYYIWLFWSQRDFDEVTIHFRDVVYLGGFLSIYYLSKVINNEIFGFFMYGFIITAWSLCIYKNAFIKLKEIVFRKRQ